MGLGLWSSLALVFASAPPMTKPAQAVNEPTVDFHQEVRPILSRACYSCHGPDKQRGGLRLDRQADAFAGGDSGTVIVPGKPAESELYRLVSGLDPARVMPPKGERLSPEELAILRRWIAQGAHWPEDGSRRANPQDWWSLKPLRAPNIPTLSPAEQKWVRTPVDAFILAKLREKQLSPAPEADRRTLIRRLSFDLTGLPPTPEEIAAFVADPDPYAYEALVDRLLASPAYGERWARHWLDVVHYGETHGYDKDKPRPNAWPYRDYVIRSFNADKPYSRFVQEQIAGDQLFPGTVDGIEALGFIAAGPWDYIGHVEVPETKIDGKIARHLDRDDMISNTVGTFLSLTVHCAQCHNHKFDPIPQSDYYRLQAVFAALDRADQRYDADPKIAARRAALLAEQQKVESELAAVNTEIQAAAGEKLNELDRRIAAMEKAVAGKNPGSAFGYHSSIADNPNEDRWVQLDLGEPRVIRTIRLRPAYDDFNQIGGGFGFPRRYRIELSHDPDFASQVTLVADFTQNDVPNPGTQPQTFAVTGGNARYVRITATRLAPRKNDFIFALAEVEVLDESQANLARSAKVTAKDSIEAAPRWQMSNLVDGEFPPPPPPDQPELSALRAEREQVWKTVAGLERLKRREALTATVSQLAEELKKLPPPTQQVYIGTIHHGSGAFRGTGPDGGRPRPIAILHRGDVTKPGALVAPGPLSQIPGMPADFQLPPTHREGERRAALAHWITAPENPLTWRSIVNRVWLYHFGRGLVDTPNDFGRMGQLPTHPELLDWLAVQFRDHGQSLKKLHRLLVTSAVYRQSSADQPAARAVDAENRYYWQMRRRKLEAEAVRDAILAVAGKLDRTMGGPSFQDFQILHPEHSPHYEYHLHNADDPKSHRRSIYRFVVRSKPNPWMAALDCADPSMAVAKRDESVTPQQALTLLNNQLTGVMAKHFAQRVESLASGPSEQIRVAILLALGREPSAAEQELLAAYAKQHGLANTCRVILNLNEFSFVD